MLTLHILYLSLTQLSQRFNFSSILSSIHFKLTLFICFQAQLIHSTIIINMAEREEEVDDQIDENYDPEAEVVGDWKKVDLPEVTLKTGEEDDEEITKFRTKLYRFRNGEWKERGVGEFKFLKNKTSGKIRVLMRGEKTHKVVINHLLQKIAPYCQLEALKTSNNSWTWAAYDISDEKPQPEKFCGKLTSKEEFQRFEKEFNKACEINESVIPKSSVGEKKQEPKVQSSNETSTQVKTEVKTEVKAEVKTEVKADVKTEVKADVKAEQPEVKKE